MLKARAKPYELVPKTIRDNGGQSLVEFLLFLPIMILLTYSTVRVNMAIQSAIVNQKYARAQTLFLAANASSYPSLSRRARPGNYFGEVNVDQMNLGVSDNVPPADAGQTYQPKATVIQITRKGKPVGNDEPQKEDHKERGRIRIRNSVALCTQYNPQNMASLAEAKNVVQTYKASGFSFCRSPTK